MHIGTSTLDNIKQKKKKTSTTKFARFLYLLKIFWKPFGVLSTVYSQLYVSLLDHTSVAAVHETL